LTPQFALWLVRYTLIVGGLLACSWATGELLGLVFPAIDSSDQLMAGAGFLGIAVVAVGAWWSGLTERR
jgi:hypothetical protein